MGLSEDIQLLREEYRQCRAYFEQDGIIDDSEHQQLDAMEAEINRLESDFMDQQQSTTQSEGDDPTLHSEVELPVSKNTNMSIASDSDGNVTVGVNTSVSDNTTVGISQSTDGVTTLSVGHENEGEEGTTSVGLEVNSEGEFTANAEHEFNNDVTASAEITNDSVSLALGKSWDLPEMNAWTYLLPPSPATFGIGVVLSGRLNGSAGIEATESINFVEGVSSIGIGATGSISGTLQVALEAGGIIQAGGNTRVTAAINGSGQLVYDGSSLSPNASITANLVVSLNVFIGLSESIISAASAFDLSRSDLTFEYPISSAELLRMVGIEITNGRVTGTPSFEPGADLVAIQNAIKSGVAEVKRTWDTISSAFTATGELIEGSVEYWQQHGVMGTLEDFGEALQYAGGELVDSATEVVSDAYDATIDTLDSGLDAAKELWNDIDLNPFD
jgi:hypothetical protein